MEKKLLQEKSYSMRGRPVIIKKWTSEFDFQRDILREVPVWIKLHNLPLCCWSIESLSRIASIVRVPLCADQCTSDQQRVNYARVLVQVDMTQDLVDRVTIEKTNGDQLVQRVEYEWRPLFRKSCSQLGHMCQVKDVKKIVQKWVPKHPNTPQVVEEKAPETTPDNPPPEITSESELGWVAATKIARHGSGPSNSAVQHSTFA